jgi:vancomycin permeability regulator SanA
VNDRPRFQRAPTITPRESIGGAADRRTYRGAAWFQLRELLSRPKAFVDVSAHRSPRHAGPPISLKGDGRLTR